MTNKHEWVGTSGLKQLLLMLVGFIYLLWQWQVMHRDRGSTTAACNSWFVVVLMQQKRAGAREWDCIRMNKGFLLAWWSGSRILPFSRIFVGNLGGRTYHERHIRKRSTHDDMQQYDACYDMAIWMCFGLMQARTDWNESIWTKGSNANPFYEVIKVH